MTLPVAGLVFSLGVLCLWGGAEFLVRGAAELGRRAGISSLVVGLTIVSLATSLPEFAVSMVAALRDAPGLALGNVVGSNIANIGIVLGSCALVVWLASDRDLLRRDLPWMVGITLLFLLFAFTGGELSRVEGGILLGLLLCFLWITVRSARNGQARGVEGHHALPLLVLWIALGLGAMVLGAEFITRAGTRMAEIFGVPEVVIGLTLVAVGTSLPELAASLIGLIRGHEGIAVGNVVGSNIFNLTFVLGTVSLARSIPVPRELFRVELPVMLLFALAALIIMRRGGIGRVGGSALLGSYVLFIGWLALR